MQQHRQIIVLTLVVLILLMSLLATKLCKKNRIVRYVMNAANLCLAAFCVYISYQIIMFFYDNNYPSKITDVYAKELLHSALKVDVESLNIIHAESHRNGIPADPSFYFEVEDLYGRLPEDAKEQPCTPQLPEPAKYLKWWPREENLEAHCKYLPWGAGSALVFKKHNSKTTYVYLQDT